MPSATAVSTSVTASEQQAAPESNAVIELTEQWIQGIVKRTTNIICTLHQACLFFEVAPRQLLSHIMKSKVRCSLHNEWHQQMQMEQKFSSKKR